jgi:protein-tyrosine sulfotransferase
MPTHQQKAMFQNLMEALSRVEGLLHKVAGGGEQALRGEAEAGLQACRTIRQVAQGTFEEAERQLVGPLAAEAALAMEEIDRRPRQDLQLRSRPTFILGHARSGTTLLAWLLDSHANLAVVPENFLCHLLFDEEAPPRHQIHERRPIPIVRAGHSLENLGESRPTFLRRIAKLIDGTFVDYAARQGKKRWVDKEPFVPRSLDLLDAVFGYSALYIYIVRHGLDAAFSASERFGWAGGTPLTRETSHNLRTYLRLWIEHNELYADFQELIPKRCLLVRYEDLVTSPEPVARRIFEFLGEPWQPTIFEDMQRQEHHRHMGDNKILAAGGAKIDPSRRGRWKGWPPALVRQLARMADPTLVRLGYPALAGTELPVAGGAGGSSPLPGL